MDEFLDKYRPEIAATARAVLAELTKRYPAAQRLVYDNCNGLAVGFGPTEKASDIVFSIALYPRWVTLFLMHGAALADPAGLLKGSGVRVRHIVLKDGLGTLRQPEVEAFLLAAVAARGVELKKGPKGKTVIKSISAKQRPRQ